MTDAWWCPAYGRATPTCYRCDDCGADLAGKPLERVDANRR